MEYSRFSDLLQYLEQKYFFIETYSVQKNALVLNCEASNHFLKDLRKYSAPFMVYGFVVLLILLFREYSALPLLINLGYGIIFFYFVLLLLVTPPSLYLTIQNNEKPRNATLKFVRICTFIDLGY